MKTERESKAIGLVRLGILGIFLANAGPLRGQSPSYAGIYCQVRGIEYILLDSDRGNRI